MGNDKKSNKQGSKDKKVVKMNFSTPKKIKKAKPAPKAMARPLAPTQDNSMALMPLPIPQMSAYSATDNLNFMKKMEKMMTKSQQSVPFEKMSQEAAGMSREYSDACMKSGTILMKGIENIVSTLTTMMQSSAEKQARLMKEAMSVKTINEFAEIQNKIAQASFDDFMSSATKISEISVKIMTESSAPVNTQISKAMQRATESMAA